MVEFVGFDAADRFAGHAMAVFGGERDGGGGSTYPGRHEERAVRPPGRAGTARPVDPRKVMQSFNTWAFKREQPDAPDRLLQVVDGAVRSGTPVPFVLYWGKGPRAALAGPDSECMDFLAALGDRVRTHHPAGAAITLILTDTHALLNGHDPAAIASYFREVGEEAARHGFACCRLSALVDAAGEVPVEAVPTGDMMRSLTVCATKWYRGEGSPEEGALTYYRLNMAEKRAVELAFPDAVFLTFNGSEFRDLFPARMPVFYMYSLRRGVGVKPWFMAADGTPGSARAA